MPTVMRFLAICLLLLSASMASAQSPASRTVEWSAMEEAWKAFSADPSGDNANKAYVLLPAFGSVTNVQEGLLVLNLIAEGIGTLESQVFNSERNAVRLAFRLLLIPDARLVEASNRMLGNLIRFNALLFLEELTNHRDLVPDLAVILGSFRRELADDKPSQDLEKKLRLKSLEAVAVKQLKSLQGECIRILKGL